MADNFWEDPRWHLVEWDPSYWTSAPKRPTAEVEIVGGGSWCAHFIHGRASPVATWALHRKATTDEPEPDKKPPRPSGH